MKIGLYFGSFNPVHTGHLIIANYVAYNTEVDKVWLVVSPQNPLKPSAALINEYDRLYFIKLAIEEEDKLRASDIEFSLPRPSYTIHTLTYLHEKFPMHEFSIIMGSDSYQNIPRWKNSELLLANYSFYIYRRPRHHINEEVPPNIKLLDAPMLDISASFIRKLIKAGKSIRYLVPDKAAEYIMRYNHYK